MKISTLNYSPIFPWKTSPLHYTPLRERSLFWESVGVENSPPFEERSLTIYLFVNFYTFFTFSGDITTTEMDSETGHVVSNTIKLVLTRAELAAQLQCEVISDALDESIKISMDIDVNGKFFWIWILRNIFQLHSKQILNLICKGRRGGNMFIRRSDPPPPEYICEAYVSHIYICMIVMPGLAYRINIHEGPIIKAHVRSRRVKNQKNQDDGVYETPIRYLRRDAPPKASQSLSP